MITIRLKGDCIVNLEPDTVSSLHVLDAERTVINISGTEIEVIEEYESLRKRIEADRGYEVEIFISGDGREENTVAPEPLELKPELEEPDPSFHGNGV